MSIIAVKEGNVLRVVETSSDIPDGTRLVLYTAEEIRSAPGSLTAWEAAQLDSALGETDEDWGDSLDSLVVKPN